MLRVSVVAATYNRKDLLMQLLESLEEQTLSRDEFEVILVDDGSNDGTREFLETYGEKSKLEFRFHLQENQGPATARNRGVRDARSELIAFTDDDCLADPGWLKSHVEFMETHPEFVGVGGKISRRRDNRISRFIDNVARMDHKETKDGEVTILVTANACYRKPAFEEVGGFDERIPWAGGEDPDLSHKILKAGHRMAKNHDAVIRHAHRDTVGGIWKNAKFTGMSGQLRVHLGLREKQPLPRAIFGLTRNHLLRAFKNAGGPIDLVVFIFLTLLKAIGVAVGALQFRKAGLEGTDAKKSLGTDELK